MEDAGRPEAQSIALPSTLGATFLKQQGLMHLAVKERQLRRGQMNECLQAIRTSIGYKSLLYRTKIRIAFSQRAKLRTYDDVHIADQLVRKHMRIYMQARQVMERLYDGSDAQEVKEKTAFLAKYKLIERTLDLKAETTVLEAFTHGLRNKKSTCFWSLENSEAARSSHWMNDCEYCHIYIYIHMALTMTSRW